MHIHHHERFIASKNYLPRDKSYSDLPSEMSTSNSLLTHFQVPVNDNLHLFENGTIVKVNGGLLWGVPVKGNFTRGRCVAAQIARR